MTKKQCPVCGYLGKGRFRCIVIDKPSLIKTPSLTKGGGEMKQLIHDIKWIFRVKYARWERLKFIIKQCW